MVSENVHIGRLWEITGQASGIKAFFSILEESEEYFTRSLR